MFVFAFTRRYLLGGMCLGLRIDEVRVDQSEKVLVERAAAAATLTAQSAGVALHHATFQLGRFQLIQGDANILTLSEV